MNELECYIHVCQINFSANIYWPETKCYGCSEEKKILGEELFKEVVIRAGALPDGIQARPRQEGESRSGGKQFGDVPEEDRDWFERID